MRSVEARRHMNLLEPRPGDPTDAASGTTIGEILTAPRQIQVRIVAGGRQLEAALRQLTAGAPVEIAISWASGGESEAESPPPPRPERYVRRLPVPDLACRKIHYLKVETIAWIEAENQYVRLHVKDKSFLVREPAMTMRHLESRLDPEQFVRVNRSHIVNLEWVMALRVEAPSKRYVLLSSGHEIAVSPSRWERLKKALDGGWPDPSSQQDSRA
jgi:DNA-binding LytR/AlgR family response regulator